jgi:hypothetical protein
MRKLLLILLSVISVSGYSQSQPTSAKTRFVNGLYIGTKLDSYFNTADSNAIYWRADSVVMAKYKGTARALAFDVAGGYVPYTGATQNVTIGNFRVSARTLLGDSIMARGSGGAGLYANGGTLVAAYGGGGGSQWVNYGFAGYDANRASSYTARSFTDKNYVDSSRALDVQLAGTQTVTGSKTFSNDILVNGLTIGRGAGNVAGNTSLGLTALGLNTTGALVTSVGFSASEQNTTGGNNTSVGYYALRETTTGSNNTGIGSAAGARLGSPSARNTTGSGNTYVGAATVGSANNNTNETVIGYDAIGNGSNTVTIGNSSVTNNYFSGRLNSAGATFTSSGSSNTVEINHSSGSGIGLNITKGGNGEGLYVNKTSGSGNAATIIGTLNATALVKSGGTSSQFLMADGSVNTSVLPSGAYLPLSGGTLTGTLNGTSAAFSGAGRFGSGGTTLGKLSMNDGTNINLAFKVGQEDATAAMINAYNDAASANIPLEFRATKYMLLNGNTLIKTTTDNGTDALQVAGSGNFSGVGLFGGSTALTGIGGGISVNSASSSGVQFKISDVSKGWIYATSGNKLILDAPASVGIDMYVNGSYGTPAFSLSTSQAATFSSTVSATGFIVSSDRRLKNIVSRSGDMVTYTLKADKNKILHYGYIAQEVEKVLPTTVSTDDKGMKAVNYIEVLVKKVNDLEKEIAELKKHNK